ncbi:MAG TPA: FliH/SctL family protein, partial [Verrucomicrobiae bacterium]
MSTHIIQFNQPLREVQLASKSAPGTIQAEPKMEQREQSAYERGLREGQQRLSAQLLQQRADLTNLERGLLESLRQAVPRVMQECEKALAELALEIARKLVGGLPVSAEMVEAVVQEALADTEDCTEYNVHLNPEDFQLLERLQSPLLTTAPARERLHFHQTTEVSRGGCIVKTKFGTVDARRETKVEVLQKSLA